MLDYDGMVAVSFDQRTVGHSKQKPTTLLTNMPEMEQLDGLRSKGVDEPLPQDLAESIRQSKFWGLWAVGTRLFNEFILVHLNWPR